MRSRSLLPSVAGLLLAMAAGSAAAADVFVIAGDAVQLNATELRELFLGERQFANGRKLVPVDNANLHRDFISRVVGIDVPKYRTVWAKKGFREGLNPPALMGSDQDVIGAIQATPGAIGYVSRLPAGMYLIDKF